MDCLTPEDGTDRLSWNVVNYQPTLRNIAEERWSRPVILFHTTELKNTTEYSKLFTDEFVVAYGI
jgi:hypothetical protein